MNQDTRRQSMTHPLHGYLQYVGPPIDVPVLRAENVTFIIRQQPTLGKVVKDGTIPTPLEPTPIIQLKVSSTVDACDNFLTSPNLFMLAQLIGVQDTETPHSLTESLIGNYTSSLHRLNDDEGKDGGFFVFGDLAVKIQGVFVLRFNLFERRDKEVVYVSAVDSSPFNAVPGKQYSERANILEVSALNRAFWNQGVRLKVRSVPKKRSPKAASGKNGHFHPYKQPRIIKQQPKSPELFDMPHNKIIEKPVPVPIPPLDLEPASGSAPPVAQAGGQVPLQQPEPVSEPRLQQMLNWQDFLGPTASVQPVQTPVVVGGESLHLQNLPIPNYESHQDSYGAAPVAQEPITDQISVPHDGLTQTDYFKRQSMDHINYQQSPGYIPRHTSQEFIPTLQDLDLPIPVTQNESIQLAPLHPMNRGPLPPESSPIDEAQPLVANVASKDRRPLLGELRMYPSADQNLSAGSMESAISLPPPNDVTDAEGPTGGAF